MRTSIFRKTGATLLAAPALLALAAACGSTNGSDFASAAGEPTGTASAALAAPIAIAPIIGARSGAGADPSSGPKIWNHGGNVMTGTINVYYIWYGDWSSANAKSILTDFATNVGGSPYFGINSTYRGANGIPISNSVRFAGSATDNYSRGKAISGGDIATIVTSAINSSLPKDPNGIYFVLTAKDVTMSGFCSSFCGWHTYGTLAGTDIKYSFVGDAETQCASSCTHDSSVSPNGDVGADGMVSVIAHELEETASDPHLDAFFGAALDDENGDQCAWTFGTTYKANGADANVRLGGRNFLIQQNLVNIGNGYCAMQAPQSAMTVGDFNGDRFADYADHRPSDGQFWAHANLKNGTFAPSGTNAANGTGCTGPGCEVLVGDFTGDGFTDYADHNLTDGTFFVHENLRNGKFAPNGTNWATGTTCAGPDCDVYVADFTGDGFADYVDHRHSDGVFYVHENLRNGTFAPSGTNWATGTTCAVPGCDVLVADFTGDGYADYADHQTWDGVFYVHENLRNGKFAAVGVNWGSGQTCAHFDCDVLVGDFTGDGYADYADHNRSDGQFWVHQNNRNGTFNGAGTNWGTGQTCGEKNADCDVFGE